MNLAGEINKILQLDRAFKAGVEHVVVEPGNIASLTPLVDVLVALYEAMAVELIGENQSSTANIYDDAANVSSNARNRLRAEQRQKLEAQLGEKD